jgi:2-dehydro-3-deoxy-D-arabinonate dehydratase
MLIVRYVDGSGRVTTGVETEDRVVPLVRHDSVAHLLRSPLAEIRSSCEQTRQRDSTAATDVRLLPPVDGRMEVWAAGVTYRRSREARVLESDRAADVYQLVYEADRPELFFKSAAWRVTGDGEQVSVREDSEINVPEPELALVLNRHGEVVGYTICNDVSSRSIEGANPLYLPQAKVYLGSCAVGPGIRPAWEVADPYNLAIEMSIHRDGELIFHDVANTSGLHRTLDDLADHLLREDVFPDGVILSTGTSLVPELPTTLIAGDRVRIAIDQIGTLTSEVSCGKAAMSWLGESADTPARQPLRNAVTGADS